MPQCEGCPLRGRPSLLKYFRAQELKYHELVIVGEAPGRTEIVQQKPFVGMSGKILRQTLAGLGIKDAYITNVVLCNPPKNATPDDVTISHCYSRLMHEVTTIRPKGLLLLGATALRTFFPEKIKIGKSRGFLTEFQGIPTIATFHPAYLLRHPDGFTDFVNDIKKLQRCIATANPEVEVLYKPPEIPVTILKNPEEVSRTLPVLRKNKVASLDLETMGFNYITDKIWTLMFYTQPASGEPGKRAFAVVDPESSSPELKSALKEVLEAPGVTWVGHNSKFDSKFLFYRLGVRWNYAVDTLLLHYALDERLTGHGLKSLAAQYFNAPDYSSEMKHYMDEGLLDKVPLSKTLRYQALDCYYTWALFRVMWEEALEDDVLRVHNNLLVPFSHSVETIELNGFHVDHEYLERLVGISEQQTKEDLETLVHFAAQNGFSKFNPRSPKQVKDILFAAGINVKSTNAHILDKLAASSEFVRLLLKYRHQEKLISTYIVPLLEKSAADGRVHTEFLLHGTKTGRLASRNPNLQNIPSDVGPVIKKAFISTDSQHLLVNVDFSQLELRVAAWYSKDQKLLQAYRDGADIHRVVASEIYGKPPDQITKLERKAAKYIDFGIIYGRGPQSIAEQLNTSVVDASKLLANFLSSFPELKLWTLKQQQKALSDGFVASPLGRKRRFPLVLPTNVGKIRRQAVNAPIQSLASDITQYALSKVQKLFPFVKVVSTVHDSIMFEVPVDMKQALEEVHRVIETAPNDIIEYRVPFTASLEVGTRWGQLKEIAP